MQKETDFTVGRWCNRWFCENRGRWSGSTVGGYRNLIYRHILPGIEGVPLAELTEDTVICSCVAVWVKRPETSASPTTQCGSVRSHKQKSIKQPPCAWGSSSGT